MDLSFTAEELAFREEVRAFIAAYLTEEARRGQRLTPSSFTETAVSRSWQAALHKRGWVAPFWPKEYGGPGWTPAERFIFETECGLAGTPSLIPMGIQMVGPVIMKYGTSAQKAFYLPRILSGEDYWCQGYSEPGAGSDLASLKTRAVQVGSKYIVNGSKIWTTHAHFANRMFALVRTSDVGKRQDGITFLLIDMDTPGISVRPITTIGGDHEVNQVFFDDVAVPVENRIGEENKGWTYAKYLLEFERGGGFRAARLTRQLNQTKAVIAGREDLSELEEDSIALRVAQIEIDIEALSMLQMMILSAVQSGQNPGPVSSVLKLRATDVHQAITRLAVDVIGNDALAWEPRRPLYGLNEPAVLSEDSLPIVPAHLNGRASGIAGGTSEVQYDVIAKRILGL